jgi:hypothetical protein
MSPQVDRLDESFTHQAVAPRRRVGASDPLWAERSYFVVSLPGGGLVNAGRQLYANAGRRIGFVSCRRGSGQRALVSSAAYTDGDDPDAAQVGPVSVEVLEPMRVARIRTLDRGGPLAVDLTYEARFPAVATDVNRIERNGQLLTEYMNFFQPGQMSGVVVTDSQEIVLDRRRAFRDRGWGVRKHEGAPARGLVFMVGAEFDPLSLYLFVYESARGEPMLTNGWLIDESGAADTVVDLVHELSVEGDVLVGGRWTVSTARGRSLELRGCMTEGLHLAAVGYRRDGHQGIEGHRRYDLTESRIVRDLSGQTDYGADYLLRGIGAKDLSGYGYCELGLGVHARYRPEPGGPRAR